MSMGLQYFVYLHKYSTQKLRNLYKLRKTEWIIDNSGVNGYA